MRRDLLTAQIEPRPDLAPEQFKELGAKVRDWYARASLPGGCARDIDAEGLRSLLGGEPPAALMVRQLAWLDRCREEQGLPPAAGEERRAAGRRLAGLDDVPEQFQAGFERLACSSALAVCCAPGRAAEVAAGLRAAGIADLVAAVRLNGRDWNDW